MSVRKYSGLLLALAMILVLVPLALAQGMTPAVEVSDQAVQNGAVTVDRVVSSGAGWIAIHADNNGQPGPDIGHAALRDGENASVNVQLDTARVTPNLWAMLHTDAGTPGVYEFPGADVPVQEGGQVVMRSFDASAAGGGAAQATETPAATAAATETPPTTGGVQATVTATVGAPGVTPLATTSPLATTVPGQLPPTGGAATPLGAVLLLALGGLVALAGLGFALARRTN